MATSDVPQSMNEEDTPVRDSKSTVAVQGIHPTLVDKSSDEEQPRTSSSGNRCVALIDDESREDDDLHEGPEFVMDEDVPGSSTDTCGRSSVMVETRVRAGSPSCPCAAFRDALRGLDQIDVVHFFSVRVVVMKNPPQFVRGAYNAAMRIALQEIEEGFQSQNEERQSRGWKLFLLLPRMPALSSSSKRRHPKATDTRQILALLKRVMDRFVDPESRPS